MKAPLFNHLCLLSEPIRVRLLHVLAAHELGVGELARVLQSPQSTISRHLKRLHNRGWLDKRSVGTASFFRMSDGLSASALQLWNVVEADLQANGLYSEDLRRADYVLAQREMDSRAFFGRHAAQWDQLRVDLFGSSYLLPSLLMLADPGLVVGDLGCGTGDVLSLLAPVVGTVIGVDQEEAMLQAAALRCADLSNVELLEGGLEALPLADRRLDLALCMLVLHHVEDLPAAFGEIHRVLRPGGRFVLLDMIEHDREEYRRSMGHKHLGFSRDALCAQATAAELRCDHWRLLPPEPAAQGPGLFLAGFCRGAG